LPARHACCSPTAWCDLRAGFCAQSPDYPLAYRWLAAALGQTAEAKEALEKAIAIAPATFDMYVRQGVPWHRSQDRAHMLEGLRKAGWREE